MSGLCKKQYNKKKTTAILLTLFLLTVLIEPWPVQAADETPTISEVYTDIGGVIIKGAIACGARVVIKGTNLADKNVVVYLKSSPEDTSPAIAEIDGLEAGEVDSIEFVAPFKDRNPEGRLIVSIQTTGGKVECEVSHRVTTPQIKMVQSQLGDQIEIEDRTRVYLPSPAQDTLTITGTQFDDRVNDLGVPRIKAYIRQTREYELTILSVNQTEDRDEYELVARTPRGIPGGSATLVIKNPDGGSAVSGDLEFVRAPELGSINPTFGVAEEPIAIRGSNLKLLVGNMGDVKLYAGQENKEENSVTDLNLFVEEKDGFSEYVLSGKMPPGSDSTRVDLRLEYTKRIEDVGSVTIKSVLPDAFYYRGAEVQPIISSIEPRAIPLKGGVINIHGDGFLGGETKVFIGDVEVTNKAYFLTPQEIKLEVPPGEHAGWCSIKIANTKSGKDAEWIQGFIYEAVGEELAVVAVSPQEAPMGKVETVTLTAKAKASDFELRGDDGWGKVYFGGIEGAIRSLRQGEDQIEIIVTTPSYVWQGGPDEQKVPVSILLYRENGLSSGSQWDKEFSFYRPPVVPSFVQQVDSWYEGQEPRRFAVPVFNEDTGTPEGPALGDFKVSILATGVLGKDNLKVYFGSQEATILDLAVVGENKDAGDQPIPVYRIRVIAPPGPQDMEQVPVTLLNFVQEPPLGPPPEYGKWYGIATKEDGFYYRTNKMILSSFRPTEGPASGGITVEIVGNNFGWSKDQELLTEKTKVFFGPTRVPVDRIIVGDSTAGAGTADIIQVQLPPQGGDNSQVQVRVETPFGTKTVDNMWFNYYPTPEKITVEEVFPLAGTVKGGTELTIKGTGFESTDTVWVGNRQAANVNVTLEKREDVGKEEEEHYRTVITCTTLPGETGAVPIKIMKKSGSCGVAEQNYIYLSAPEITSLTPAWGTAEGGTWLLLRGNGFLAPETVQSYVYDAPGVVQPEDGFNLKVKFNGQDAGQVSFLSATEVAVKTPVGPYRDRNTEVDVELVNPDAFLDEDGLAGRAAKTKGFQYRAPASSPKIESLDPKVGPVSGGTKVIITGSDFRKDAAVFFKWKPAAKVTRIDYNTLEVITPPALEDWVDEEDGVDVTVINTDDGGQSEAGKFQYAYPRTRPEVHSIVPAEGSVDGGTLVTIRGYDFGQKKTYIPEDESEPVTELELPKVYFGNNKATVSYLSNERTMLRIIAPACLPGKVDIRVMNPDSATVTASGAFIYRYVTTAPVIQSVTPNQGRAGGGTPVVIAGSGFSRGAKVYFNNELAQVDATKSSETTLFVYSPPGKAGERAYITVLNPDGASDTTLEEEYLYVPDPKLQPRVTQIVPNKGPVTGSVPVDIWGVNMKHLPDQQLTVLIGHRPVEIMNSFPDPNKEKADQGYVQHVQVEVPPAEEPGPVDVSVINGDGGVFTVPGGFTYTHVTEPMVLDAMAPAKGPYLTSIPAQINGSGFLDKAQVFLGGREISDAEVVNEGTAIVFTVPAAPVREEDLSLDVVVVNPNGATARLVDGFTYVAKPGSKPELKKVLPGNGRSSGGTPVTIHGDGFVQALPDGSLQTPVLFFGGRLAAKTTFLSEGELSAITPPGPDGPVNVTIINPDGAMARLVSGFIYEDKPGPVISSINPTGGSSGGGTEVVVSGSGFDPGVKVFFGHAPARSVQRESESELQIVTPEGDLGPVDVVAVNPDGSSYTLPDAFTYVGPPKPPEGLEARAVSANTIELRWLPATGAAGYEINAGKSRSDQYFLASTTGEIYGALKPKADEPVILYYYAEDLEADTRYYFSVQAVNREGVSGQTWTASARTLKRSHSEPEEMPAATDYTISGSGLAGAVITVPPALLKDSRIRLDLMKPEHENTRTFTIVVPAAEADRRSTIYLSAPRLKLELSVRAVNAVQVRSLSRREREQASIHVTVEEARGWDATALLRKTPDGRALATPIYRLAVRLSSGGQEKELAWLEERVALTTNLNSPDAVSKQPTLYYYDPSRDTWVSAGYFSTWSADAALDRPGYWAVFTTRR